MDDAKQGQAEVVGSPTVLEELDHFQGRRRRSPGLH